MIDEGDQNTTRGLATEREECAIADELSNKKKNNQILRTIIISEEEEEYWG